MVYVLVASKVGHWRSAWNVEHLIIVYTLDSFAVLVHTYALTLTYVGFQNVNFRVLCA